MLYLCVNDVIQSHINKCTTFVSIEELVQIYSSILNFVRHQEIGTHTIYLCGPIISGTQTTLEEAKPNIWSNRFGLCKRVLGPTSYLKVKEYPRTINKGRNKVLLRGEVKDARVDLTMSEDYSHLGNSIRGVWWTHQSFSITPRTNPTAKRNGKISNRR